MTGSSVLLLELSFQRLIVSNVVIILKFFHKHPGTQNLEFSFGKLDCQGYKPAELKELVRKRRRVCAERSENRGENPAQVDWASKNGALASSKRFHFAESSEEQNIGRSKA
jgi:hypothetical protein